MKRLITSYFPKALFLLFFSAVIVVNSCIKDQVLRSIPPGINGLNDAQKVHPDEILAWMNATLPSEDRAQIQLNNAEQNFIANQHVVRIPIGKNAALFFTKADGKLQVFAY